MIKHSYSHGFAHAFLIIGLVVALIGALGFVFWQNFIYKEPVAHTETIKTRSNNNASGELEDNAYEGSYTLGGNFQVKIPNGWSAKSGPYTGLEDSQVVLLAGPNELDELKYNASTKPIINSLDGLGWDGRTEHFYIMSQEDDSLDSSGSSAQDFKLTDGTVGKLYTKELKKEDEPYSEAFPEGTFQQDAKSYTEYVYEFKKGDTLVRAYLSLYSNSKFDVNLANQVIKSLKIS